ncbi:hypothetical protein [Aeoliella mucimassa]|uniref:Uncharacterized protein n=1 Tax=Aeoliella mucimassa TaxID=2527972 RepID=A0A518AVP8_9BACT|nr:hypothetical protein [Aeoliella mucimassa]QDU58788.1 hypothetical protein Pan181_50280 [Aeoliella mucimassa]
MKTYLIASWLLLTTVLVAPVEVRSEAIWDTENDEHQYQVIRMTVTPADEPVPVFKHRLSLRPHELMHGNSVAHYMRAFAETGIQEHWKQAREQYGEEVESWYDTEVPISELPVDKMKEITDFGIWNYIAPGSKCRDTDWGVAYEDLTGIEIIALLLPEVQNMRSVGRAISLHTRLAIAEHRYDDAIELMRINYRLAADTGQQPILVSGLVGFAIQGITTNNMLDLIAAEDSPNMYWALSEMPRPLISLRDAIRLELAIGPRMFKMLDHPERQQHSYEEWNAIWQRDVGLLFTPELLSSPNPDWGAEDQMRSLLGMGFALAGYSHAKQRLVSWGHDPDEVEQMAVGQALAYYQAGVYQRIADSMERSQYVDFVNAQKMDRKQSEMLRGAGPFGASEDRELLPIGSLLLPAITAARSAEVRTDRDVQALRVIEALRMHAAENNATWPESLDAITCVPVPNNPATGEPFEYHLQDDTAVLVLPMSDGLRIQKRYELKLAE